LYFSSTEKKWVKAKVHAVNKGPDGKTISYDLDAKSQAAVGRVRPAGKADHPTDAAAEKVAENRTKKRTANGSLKNPAHGGGSGNTSTFKEGDLVQYWSKKTGTYVRAIVQASRHQDGVVLYDLRCKNMLVKGAPTGRVRVLNREAKAKGASRSSAKLPRTKAKAPVHPQEGVQQSEAKAAKGVSKGLYAAGDEVWYWSGTASKWVKAQVKGLNVATNGSVVSYNLNMKEKVDFSRMRAASVEDPDTPPPDPPAAAGTSFRAPFAATAAAPAAGSGASSRRQAEPAASRRRRRVSSWRCCAVLEQAAFQVDEWGDQEKEAA